MKLFIGSYTLKKGIKTAQKQIKLGGMTHHAYLDIAKTVGTCSAGKFIPAHYYSRLYQ